ncbi:MAG: hypothetical protein ACYSTL_06570, partial [Planctomycetota bacterium]
SPHNDSSINIEAFFDNALSESFPAKRQVVEQAHCMSKISHAWHHLPTRPSDGARLHAAFATRSRM